MDLMTVGVVLVIVALVIVVLKKKGCCGMKDSCEKKEDGTKKS